MYKKDLYGKTIRKKIVFHGGFYMFGLIIALISGALMSIQGVFNTEVTKQSSTWTTSTFVQATGFLACLLIWLIAEREQSFTMLLKVSPRYLLLGGVIGAVITFTVIKKCGKFRTCTVSNADRRITKCCFLSDRGFRSVWCGKNSFCMGKAFRSGFVCHRIDNI